MKVAELYRAELARHGYSADRAQLAAIAKLDTLRTALSQVPGAGAGLARLLRRGPLRTTSTPVGGLYLWGSVGRGKTWLVDLFFQSLDVPQRLRSHFHHFMRDVHAALREQRQQRDPLQQVARALATQYRVICLDELYVSDIADAMILGTLFEALLQAGTALVITSNCAPRGLYRDGLQRARFLPAIALLESRLVVHELAGATDFRLRALQRAPIYLSSLNPALAREQMAALFVQLAGEHGEHQAELRIADRPLAAWRRSSDVVWFGFETLCEGARSQNDYVEIAEEFHTVFVSDVPRFGPEHEDAARRFIALVDEFYDQGVKLVVSAATPPTELYGGERLRFEFARTASRLIEMQSESYLARAHHRGVQR
jgi:cell division protein ZapE